MANIIFAVRTWDLIRKLFEEDAIWSLVLTRRKGVAKVVTPNFFG